MSGLATLCNAGPLIQIGGKYYQIQGRTLRHLGEAESQILYMRGDLLFYLRTSIEGMERDDALSCCERVLRKIRYRWIGCNNEDIQRFYSSVEGRVYSFWQSIRNNGVDYSQAQDMYFQESDRDEEWERRIKLAIEMTTGDAEICKLYKVIDSARAGAATRDGYLISRSSLFASLFQDPFSYSPDQIADMTLGQISLILAGKEDSVDDINAELNLAALANNPGTRRMRKPYMDSYREMSLNIVEGRPLTSSLKS
jgi:hypothetical protein